MPNSKKKEAPAGEFKETTTPINDMSAQKQRRLLQCWLMENMGGLQANASKSYANFVNMLGDSRVVRNELISINGCQGLFELTNQQISSMVPKFTLAKEGKSSSATFHFDSHIKGIDDMLTTRVGRGSNVGFKSFSYEMKGGSPATAESLIEAKLVIHFASLTDLYRARDGSPSFADLLGQPSRLVKGAKCVVGASDKKKAENNDFYKISVSLGYNTSTKAIDSGIKGQMDKASRTFNLTLIQHSVSFKQDGSLELELEYQSYIDRLMVQADVLDLALTPEQRKTLNAKIRTNCQKKETVKSMKAKSSPGNNCGSNGTPTATPTTEDSEEEEAIKEEIEETAESIQTDKANAYSRLFNRLFEKDRVWVARVKAEDLLTGASTPSPAPSKDLSAEEREKERQKALKQADSDRKKAAAAAKETVSDLVKTTDSWVPVLGDKREKKLQEALNDGGVSRGAGGGLNINTASYDAGDLDLSTEVMVAYFYFGDLLDAALECLNGTEAKYNNLKILVGTFPHRNGSNVPLASIPISLQLFQAWFLKHVIMKEKDAYPLKAFISDTFSNLIRPALSPKNCYGKKHLIPRLGIETVSLPAASGGKCRISGSSVNAKGGSVVDVSKSKVKKPSKSAAGSKSKLPDALYYYIYATSITSVRRSGDLSQSQKTSDQSKGIYWLKAGTTTGLVKKITFKKTDQPGMKEARIESEGASSGTLFVDRYNADVELFGTSIFKPGMTVFIDPITSSIEGDRKTAVGVGLGGYYKVIAVSTSLEPGSYKTDLTCVWESPTASSSPVGGCK